MQTSLVDRTSLDQPSGWVPALARGQLLWRIAIGRRAAPALLVGALGLCAWSPRASAQACESPDARCLTDSALTQLRDAVVRIEFEDDQDETQMCTGTLLKTRGASGQITMAPYVLTASHCVPNQATADTVQTVWFHQRERCDGTGTDARAVRHTGGADLLAQSGAETEHGDWALIRLRTNAPAGAHHAPWAEQASFGTNGSASATVAILHHPRGEHLRYASGTAQFSTPQTSTGPAGADSGLTVRVQQGEIASGSSGAGYFHEGRLIGVLFGGGAGCLQKSLGSSMKGIYPHVARWLDPDADVTGPVLESATVPVGGESITLTFDENLINRTGKTEAELDAYLAAIDAALDVQADGESIDVSVAFATLNNAQLLLQVAAPTFEQDQNVVITYADPTTGDDEAIEDESGNDAKSFTTGEDGVPAVVNNSTLVLAPRLEAGAEGAVIEGDRLTLTFNEALDPDSIPAAPGGFTLTVERGDPPTAVTAPTVTQIAANGAVLTATLSAGVRHGDTVTFAYAPPATNPLQDADMRRTRAFNARSVDNRTTLPTVALSSEMLEEGSNDTVTLALHTGGTTYAGAQTFTVVAEGDAKEGEDWSIASKSLTLAAGETQATTTVSPIDDLRLEPDRTVEFKARLSGMQSAGTTLTIADDDEARIGLETNAAGVNAGDTIQVTLSLLPGDETKTSEECIVDFPVTVELTIAGDTAALAQGVAATSEHTFAATSFDDCTDTLTVDVATAEAQPGDTVSKTLTFDAATVAGQDARVRSAQQASVTVLPAPGVASIERIDPETSPTNADSLTWRVTFTEDVSNVDATDFTVDGTTATVTSVTALEGSASVYDVTVSGGDLAGLDGAVSLHLASGSDIEDGDGLGLGITVPLGTNDNAYVVDNTNPTVEITGVPAASRGVFRAHFTFSEPVKGFALEDITVNAGEASSLRGSDGDSGYSAAIRPTTEGLVTIDVAANAAIDVAGNGSEAAAQASTDYTPAPPGSVASAEMQGREVTLGFNDMIDPASKPSMRHFTLKRTYIGSSFLGSGNERVTRLIRARSMTFDEFTVTVTFGGTARAGDELHLDYDPDITNRERHWRETWATPVLFEGGLELGAFANLDIENMADDTQGPTLRDDLLAVDGDTLTMKFDEALDTGSVPAKDDFTVEARQRDIQASRTISVDAVRISGKTMTLTLAEAVGGDRIVTMSYWLDAARGGTGTPIRDEAGNATRGGGQYTVDNRTVTGDPGDRMTPTIIRNTLTLMFDQSVAATSKPSRRHFVVKRNVTDRAGRLRRTELRVNQVAVDGATVTLTVGGAIEAGDEVRLDYDPERTNRVAHWRAEGATPIRFEGGETLGAFTNIATSNLSGDTKAPSLLDDQLYVDADTLVMPFDERLDPRIRPAQADFTVTAGGTRVVVTTVRVSGQSLALTLAEAVGPGDAVTLDYRLRQSGVPVMDLAGNPTWGGGLYTVENRTAGPVEPTDTEEPHLLEELAFVDGDTLTLTYNEELDPNSVPDRGDFRITTAPYNHLGTGAPVAVVNVRITGRTVVLTLARNVNAGDPVEVDYLLTMGGIPVMDLAGNEHWAGSAGRIDNRTAQVREVTPLTAGFAKVPPEHDGKSIFKLKLVFSEEPRMSYKAIGTHLLSVEGGTLYHVKRVRPPKNKEYRIRIEPSGDRPVVLTTDASALPPCGEPLQICTADGRGLEGTATTTIPGPLTVSVADATVEEGPGAMLEFVVTLSRGRHAPVTVYYETSDGTGANAATAEEDYTAVSSTLTFEPGAMQKTISVAVLDDAHDEGDETMRLTLSNPQPAAYVRIADGTATGTIENTDPMPKAWIVRVGRTVGSQVVEALTGRLEGDGGSHVAVGGLSLGTGPTLESEAGERRTLKLPEWGERTRLDAATRTMTRKELLLGSSFHLSTEGGESGQAEITAWGHVATGGFDAEEDGVTLDGDVITGFLGADAKWDRVLAGVMVSQSKGDGSYRVVPEPGSDVDGDEGKVESSLTGVYPYLEAKLNERISAWGLVGVGSGGLTLRRKNEVLETDLGMRMGAVGIKGRMLDGTGPSGIGLDLKSDAMWVGTKSVRTEGMMGAEGEVSRVRIIVKGERPFATESGGMFTPSGEVGLRVDGGDAETGAGLELGAVLRYAKGPLSIEGAFRGLVAHEESGYEEWGASGSVRVTPGESGLGLTFSLAPVWGNAGSQAERLWGASDAREFGAGGEFDPGVSLEAELGYGFGVPGALGVVTPYAGLSLAEDAGRTVRAGARWQLAPGAVMGLEGTRQGGANGLPGTNAVEFRTELRW